MYARYPLGKQRGGEGREGKEKECGEDHGKKRELDWVLRYGMIELNRLVDELNSVSLSFPPPKVLVRQSAGSVGWGRELIVRCLFTT